MDRPKYCGLCQGMMAPRHYNAAREGVRMQEVHLCNRCDLKPDPPVQITQLPEDS